MPITKIILLYALTVPVFLLVDLVWLGFVAKDFYKNQLGALMRTDPIWWAAILFYLLFIIGILYFAVLPAVAVGAWTRALTLGALFGFFTYMTYDLTNYALITGWPFSLIAIDILWGSFLTGTVATASFFIARLIV